MIDTNVLIRVRNELVGLEEVQMQSMGYRLTVLILLAAGSRGQCNTCCE